ncbi:hypothetical protein GCM10023163_02820 [Aestuariibaculum suncheonense]
MFISCESIDFTDCIIKKSAELQDKQLKRGYAKQYYYDEIRASVNNDSDDDGYDYTFYVKGRLPEGIEESQDGRFLVFEGVTLETGSFILEVSVSAVAYETDDENGISLCGVKSTSKSYTLIFSD